MSSQKSEHSSENYQVTMEQEPGCVVHYTIQVSPKETSALHSKAIKTISKEVSIPGFRKGKAPKEIILKNYASHVTKEWKDLVLQTAGNEAMKLTKVYPFQKNSVKKADIPSCSLEEGSTVTLTFEAMPNIPDIEASTLELPNVEAEPVSETKVNQIIEDIRYQFAEWEDVEGRPVESGDFVDVDIENLDEPGQFLCQDTRLELKSDKIGKWLMDLMLGMNVGESREGTSEQEEGQNNPNFKPTHCKVTVKAIQKSTLPEVNDALAEKAGLSSAEELRDKVKQDLATMAEQQRQETLRQAIEKAILSKYPFEVPESLVEERAQQLMDQRKAEIEANAPEGASLEEEFKKLEEEVFNTVRDSYRWYFITHKTAQQQGIEVDKREVFTEMIQQRYMDQASQFNEDSMEQLYGYLASKILSRKVSDFFIESNKEKNSSEDKSKSS